MDGQGLTEVSDDALENTMSSTFFGETKFERINRIEIIITHETVYLGQVTNKKMDGKGTLFNLKTGVKYVGNFKDGAIQG